MPVNRLITSCLHIPRTLLDYTYKLSPGFRISFSTFSNDDEESSTCKPIPENKSKQNEKYPKSKWTPRRRVSLSPTERLLTALSEDTAESTDHNNTNSSGTNVQSSLPDAKTLEPLPNDRDRSTEVPVSEVARCSTGVKSETTDEQKDLLYSMHLKRRHLSPLKRLSGMIPDKFWKENDSHSSVKRDVDELIKSEEPFKKNE